MNRVLFIALAASLALIAEGPNFVRPVEPPLAHAFHFAPPTPKKGKGKKRMFRP